MEIDQLPDLDRPNVIAAFSGWNDAGQSATTAVRYLVDSWKASGFARIDAEEYFSFTDTRPIIRISNGNISERSVEWPKNEFFAFPGSGSSPSAVLMIGVEPNLKWRSFCGEIVRLARSVGARRLVTLGSLVTDAVHTRPVPLTGFSTDPDVQSKFISRQIGRSNYEGPTGIVGVLHDASRNAEILPAAPFGEVPAEDTTDPPEEIPEEEVIDDGSGELVSGPTSSSGLMWPISGPVSSYYGPSHPLGIDVDGYNLAGSAIVAATSGTVIFAGGNACCSYGLYVVIMSDSGIETLYAHLDSIYVSQGQFVSQGESLGVIGDTGYSTGRHLHFEVIDNGVRQDPMSYLP